MAKNEATNKIMKLYVLCVLLLSLFSNAQSSKLDLVYKKAERMVFSLKIQLEELKQSYKEITVQKGTHETMYPSSCLAAGINSDGIHVIEVPGLEPFPASCDTRLAGSGWTVIQRRQDGSENFYRSWEEYSQGFGELSGEFFMGLEKLHFLTLAEPYELFVYMEDFDGMVHDARYEDFAIGNASESYALSVLGKYSGDAGDSLRYHKGMPFSTFDHDDTGHGCARIYVGAWWYDQCQRSNLNGQYLEGGRFEPKMSGRGITWMSWRGYDYGYKFVQMMIRPKCSNNLRRQGMQNAQNAH
ncbi:microfibril-associated glycoprotein 4 isoform X2 [Drosophila santomea]|uniref:microfibril-associated glycoprotein 4 isoform X2 n=1 Tax=Drosophila santomea TaxID=129105 RepID=UPI001952A399|nr:microfibril-associated glycoprotein 4 isoform X2 [Drosophila santomea]